MESILTVRTDAVDEVRVRVRTKLIRPKMLLFSGDDDDEFARLDVEAAWMTTRRTTRTTRDGGKATNDGKATTREKARPSFERGFRRRRRRREFFESLPGVFFPNEGF